MKMRQKNAASPSNKLYYFSSAVIPMIFYGLYMTTTVSSVSVHFDQKYTKPYKEWLEKDNEDSVRRFKQVQHTGVNSWKGSDALKV